MVTLVLRKLGGQQMSVNGVLFTFKSLNCQSVLYLIIVINTCMNGAPKKLVIHSAKQS